MNLQTLLTSSQSCGEFLTRYLEARAAERKQFSLRQLANKMGYTNPSLVSDLMRNKRKPNVEFIPRFKKLQELTLMEERYLMNLFLGECVEIPEVVEGSKAENQAIRKMWGQEKSGKNAASESDLFLTEIGAIKAQSWLEYFRQCFDLLHLNESAEPALTKELPKKTYRLRMSLSEN